MSHFTFVVEPWGFEVVVQATTEKEAHKLAFDGLSEAQKNNCECLDLVEQVAA